MEYSPDRETVSLDELRAMTLEERMRHLKILFADYYSQDYYQSQDPEPVEHGKEFQAFLDHRRSMES